jgi:hypothetical protein
LGDVELLMNREEEDFIAAGADKLIIRGRDEQAVEVDARKDCGVGCRRLFTDMNCCACGEMLNA